LDFDFWLAFELNNRDDVTTQIIAIEYQAKPELGVKDFCCSKPSLLQYSPTGMWILIT